jgi:hypothetical protein
MAAVRVVLPWSTCPIVPMFTWGFVRWNTVDNHRGMTAAPTAVHKSIPHQTKILSQRPLICSAGVLTCTASPDGAKRCTSRDQHHGCATNTGGPVGGNSCGGSERPRVRIDSLDRGLDPSRIIIDHPQLLDNTQKSRPVMVWESTGFGPLATPGSLSAPSQC